MDILCLASDLSSRWREEQNSNQDLQQHRSYPADQLHSGAPPALKKAVEPSQDHEKGSEPQFAFRHYSMEKDAEYPNPNQGRPVVVTPENSLTPSPTLQSHHTPVTAPTLPPTPPIFPSSQNGYGYIADPLKLGEPTNQQDTNASSDKPITSVHLSNVPSTSHQRVTISQLVAAGLLPTQSKIQFKSYRAVISDHGKLIPYFPPGNEQSSSDLSEDAVERLKAQSFDTPSSWATALMREASSDGQRQQKANVNGWSAVKVWLSVQFLTEKHLSDQVMSGGGKRSQAKMVMAQQLMDEWHYGVKIQPQPLNGVSKQSASEQDFMVEISLDILRRKYQEDNRQRASKPVKHRVNGDLTQLQQWNVTSSQDEDPLKLEPPVKKRRRRTSVDPVDPMQTDGFLHQTPYTYAWSQEPLHKRANTFSHYGQQHDDANIARQRRTTIQTMDVGSIIQEPSPPSSKDHSRSQSHNINHQLMSDATFSTRHAWTGGESIHDQPLRTDQASNDTRKRRKSGSGRGAQRAFDSLKQPSKVLASLYQHWLEQYRRGVDKETYSVQLLVDRVNKGLNTPYPVFLRALEQDTQKQVDSADQFVLLCGVCNGFCCFGDMLDKKVLRENGLVFCDTCATGVHISCLEASGTNLSHWRCWNCTDCSTCHVGLNDHPKTEQPLAVTYCSNCRRCTHVQCIENEQQRQQIRNGEAWVCTDCRECIECHTRIRPSASEKGWTNDCLLCPDCSLLVSEGNICPICIRTYRNDDYETPMIGCDGCNKWIHMACDKSIQPSDYETMGEAADSYFCPMCKEFQDSPPTFMMSEPASMDEDERHSQSLPWIGTGHQRHNSLNELYFVARSLSGDSSPCQDMDLHKKPQTSDAELESDAVDVLLGIGKYKYCFGNVMEESVFRRMKEYGIECCLCPDGEPSNTAHLGILLPLPLAHGQPTRWAHGECLLFSNVGESACLDQNDVIRTIQSSYNQICHLCKQPGAAVKCNCGTLVCHLACAFAAPDTVTCCQSTRRIACKSCTLSAVTRFVGPVDGVVIRTLPDRQISPIKIPGRYIIGSVNILSIGSYGSVATADTEKFLREADVVRASSLDPPFVLIPPGFKFMRYLQGQWITAECAKVSFEGKTDQVEQPTVVIRMDCPTEFESEHYAWNVLVSGRQMKVRSFTCLPPSMTGIFKVNFSLARARMLGLSPQSTLLDLMRNMEAAEDVHAKFSILYDIAELSRTWFACAGVANPNDVQEVICSRTRPTKQSAHSSVTRIIDLQGQAAATSGSATIATKFMTMKQDCKDALVLRSSDYTSRQKQAEEVPSNNSVESRRRRGSLTITTVALASEEAENQSVSSQETKCPTEFILYTTRSFEKDEMMGEYTGELVPRLVGERRQRAYLAKNRNCYMAYFGDHCIDASRCGGKVKYIQVCRKQDQPSAYAKVWRIDGKDRLVLHASRHLDADQIISVASVKS